MVGIILLLVGAVLLHNGVCILMKTDGKASSTINIMGGLIIGILYMVYIFRTGDYLLGGAGLLFAITYVYIGLNGIFSLDVKPFGWFCLFVTITIIGEAVLAFARGSAVWSTYYLTGMWILWGILWFALFIEDALSKHLGRFVPYLCLFTAFTTGLIPGFMMIAGWW